MWKDKKVSVIFPTYNEKGSIRHAIEDFFASGFVDEIIVVNNNAVDGTDQQVKKTSAKLVYEKRQGYGYAIWKGLEEATGDLLIISEPDGTFSGRDVIKLLAYSDDFDYVLGTRTTRELIWQGANMGFFLKWGNWAVAKMLEFLYNTTTLTDVGCTMRLISKKLYNNLRPYFTVGTQHFGPELTILVAKNKVRFMEIPVNYKPRVGESSVTGSFREAFVL
ncbi:MAG: glycosyltransferase family 2 protein [Candidatus Omnitrophica bacterium]|nr:glycosyltransferase family 2 protein [Candidatus Omnitrophota bacterium]